MYNYIIIAIVILGYLGLGFYITRLIRKKLRKADIHLKWLILSLVDALVFGIGMVGGGGDPGFALPCPILVAGFLDLWSGVHIRYFVNGILLPLFCWWVLIFLVLWIKNKIITRKKL